jgi:hypothetical protein
MRKLNIKYGLRPHFDSQNNMLRTSRYLIESVWVILSMSPSPESINNFRFFFKQFKYAKIKYQIWVHPLLTRKQYFIFSR